MEMTPRRQQMIDAHVAETHALMVELAFELNDLVRFALSAAKEKGHKVYYPMDPVNECIRNWQGLNTRLTKLAQSVAETSGRLGVQPFDPEAPEGGEMPTPSA
jgi:hypothetical protein